ncbi:universal stress protein PHOS32-like [Silene latifolia]|uniref:universal stress protein PHOS32-like n=1 Tax=Silene latifolia TaxID=37657 RepID=UPI003D7853C7
MDTQLRNVVVAVDGSNESMNALRWALDNVSVRSPLNGGSFVVLHVQSPPSIAVGFNPGSIPFGGANVEVPAFKAAIEDHQRRITDAILQEALKICAENNVIVKTRVVIGNPKRKICEVVDELHADLLVMGSRSFGRFKRMLSGSVSKYCSHQASCPVIIVKAESGQTLPAYYGGL